MPDEEIAKWKAKGEIQLNCYKNGGVLSADPQGWNDINELFNKMINSPYSSHAKIILESGRYCNCSVLEIHHSRKSSHEFFWTISNKGDIAIINIGIAGLNCFMESIESLKEGDNDFYIYPSENECIRYEGILLINFSNRKF